MEKRTMSARPTRVATLLAAVAVVAVGCGGEASTTTESETTAEFPLTVESCGTEVVFDAPPEQVLTIGTVAVNLIHAAGGADLIAARSGEFGTAPAGDAGAAVADVPVLVDEDPALEPIIGSGVDTVIGYGLFETTPEDLEASGIRHLTASGYCGDHGGGEAEGDLFEAVVNDVRTYGQLFGTATQAAETASELEAALAEIEPLDDAGTIAGVYWFFGPDPSAYGAGSMADAMFDRLGATNVFGDVDSAFMDLSIEALLEADPDTIVLFHSFSPDVDFEESKRRLLELPGAEDLRAVANDRIVGLSYVVAEPDPAAVEGLRQLAEALAAP